MKSNRSGFRKMSLKSWIILIIVIVLIPVIGYGVYTLNQNNSVAPTDTHAGSLGGLTGTFLTLDIPEANLDAYFADMAPLKYKYLVVNASATSNGGSNWNIKSLCYPRNVTAVKTSFNTLVGSSYFEKIFANAKKYNIKVFFGGVNYNTNCFNISSGISNSKKTGKSDAYVIATENIKIATDIYNYAKKNNYTPYLGGFFIREGANIHLYSQKNSPILSYVNYLSSALKTIGYTNGTKGPNLGIKPPYQVLLAPNVPHTLTYDQAYNDISVIMNQTKVDIISLDTGLDVSTENSRALDVSQYKALSDSAKKYNKTAWASIKVYDTEPPINPNGGPNRFLTVKGQIYPITIAELRARIGVAAPYVSETIARYQQYSLLNDKSFYNLNNGGIHYIPSEAIMRAQLRAGYDNFYNYNITLKSIAVATDTRKGVTPAQVYISTWVMENTKKMAISNKSKVTMNITYPDSKGNIKTITEDVSNITVNKSTGAFTISLPWSWFGGQKNIADSIAIELSVK